MKPGCKPPLQYVSYPSSGYVRPSCELHQRWAHSGAQRWEFLLVNFNQMRLPFLHS